MNPIQFQKAFGRPTVWWVLVVAFLTIVILFIGDISGPPDIAGIIFIGSCLSLFAAMGVWLGVGSDWRRIPILILSTSIVAATLMTTGPSYLEGFLLMLFLGALMIGVVAVPIILFRVLKHGCLAKPDPNEKSVKEALQFGVLHLLGVMTAVAVIIWLGQILAPILNNLGGGSFILIVKLGVSFSLASLTMVWATLGNHPMIRNAISVPIAGGLAYANSLLFEGSRNWIYAALTITVMIEIAILMWCLRLEGYRFISRRRESKMPTPSVDLDL